ncbi:hypothetical protein LCGC14_2324900 [marine sediment metagenome]|uniref:DUF4234 domain-containing protein n=1 Tax=marine sediment metagenome TaxID=412755 RepID=A0A0F9EU42_9ZZZZ
MLKDYPKLERTIFEGREQENPLINWWLFLVLVVGLSFIIVGLVIYLIIIYQRIERRDKHFARMGELFRTSLRTTEEVAKAKGIDIYSQKSEIEEKIKVAEDSLLRPKNAVLWTVLMVLTGGLVAFYVYYFLLVDWYRIQRLEQDIMDDFSDLWTQLDIVKDPIPVSLRVPERSYWAYLGLSIITLGIWLFYWDYVTHTEPDHVFPENRSWEDKILSSFREPEGAKAA